jgi:hypothetical protein
MSRFKTVFAIALGLACIHVPAEAKRLGSEFQVTAEASAQFPLVAGLAGGGFVVIWIDQNGSGIGIYGQRYDANGMPVGDVFSVRTFTNTNQVAPAVAALTDGGFIVAWQSLDEDGSGFGIYAQRYAADGGFVGPEFRVNTYTDNDQSQPAVAGLVDGGFVVSWTSKGQIDNDETDALYGQRFRSSGRPVGGEFLIDEVYGSQPASILGLTDGKFVIVWSDGNAVYARQFGRGGAPFGGLLQVNTTGAAGNQSVAALANGGFVVSWSASNQTNGIAARIFRATEAPTTGDLTIATPAAGEILQSSPTGTAALTNGDIIIVWDSIATGAYEPSDVIGQQLRPSGRRRGTEFKVNGARQFAHYSPSVASLHGGGYVAVWTASGQRRERGIFGQRFGTK